ncbi:MAG: hypothetical protein GY749_24030 [Desulfobacteraceae bacterium]|nr:hypothetical protein [Desulfobacteraceae bacterium]
MKNNSIAGLLNKAADFARRYTLTLTDFQINNFTVFSDSRSIKIRLPD